MFAGLKLSSPTLLAPMQGIGTAGIRDVVADLGRPGMICTPFVRVTAQRPNVNHIRSQLRPQEGSLLCAQLLGNHPEHLAFAARVLSDAGADVVDLNLGCPTRQANRKGVGAALLPHVDVIRRIVQGMRASCTCALSAKIRASEGDIDEVVSVARAIESEGADFLVVHPRKRSQNYEGVADWGIVKRLSSNLRIPVVGNGDLWYAGDALRLMRQSGADAVMIGRPALRNPFIFRQFEELRAGKNPYIPTGNDIVAYVQSVAERARTDLASRARGPSDAVKEVIQYLLRAVPEPLRTNLRRTTMHAATLEGVLAAIEPLRDAPVLDVGADGPLRFEITPKGP